MTVRTRFTDRPLDDPFGDFDAIVDRAHGRGRRVLPGHPAAGTWTTTSGACSGRRLPGLLWSKQFYHYSVELWLDGDPAGPPPPPARRQGRNAELAACL